MDLTALGGLSDVLEGALYPSARAGFVSIVSILVLVVFFFSSFFSSFPYDLRSTTVNKATPRRGFSGVEAGMETKKNQVQDPYGNAR
jgi:hypothetical protein